MFSFLSSPPHIVELLCVLILGGSLIGYPLSLYFDTDRRHRMLLAPFLGLAVSGAVSLPIFMRLPFNILTVSLVELGVAAACWIAGRWIKQPAKLVALRLSWAWIVVAALISIIPAYAVAPHIFHQGIGFGVPIFDHEKVTIIDEMVRNGTPPRNPFIIKDHASPLLNYYYGWYFLAAQAALLTGSNGWTTDIVFTGVTAFFSLVFMGWAALRFCERQAAAWVVIPLSLVSALGPILIFVFGSKADHILVPEHGLETWIVQSAWVPQHLFSAVIGCLAIIGFVKLLQCLSFDPILCLIIGILVGFSYNTSVWVGLTGLLPIMAVTALLSFNKNKEKTYFINLFFTGLTSLIVVLPLALQQSHRLKTGPIISSWIFPVFTQSHSFLANMVNILGYWTYLLVVDFGVLYVLTLYWTWQRFIMKKPWDLEEKTLVISSFLPLLVAETLHSVIATNDLGWRCVLISVMAMTVVAARVIVQQIKRVYVMIVSFTFLILGLLTGITFVVGVTSAQALYGVTNEDSTRFLTVDKSMWQAVASVTPPLEAIANNPAYERSLTPWEGNISWAMLSNRESCTPPFAYLAAFSADDTKAQQVAFAELIKRVFTGTPQSSDFKVLRNDYNCRTLLVVPSDSLWHLPLTTPSPYFELVTEKVGQWRIYRAR